MNEDHKPEQQPETDQSEVQAPRQEAATVSPAPQTVVSSPTPTVEPRSDELVVRGFPKVVFLWPIALLSLLFFFAGGGWWSNEVTSTDNALGFWWLLVFTVNMLVFTFDFGRANFITCVTVTGMIVLGLIAWDQASDTAVWDSIYAFFADLNVAMNSNFYLSMFVILDVLIGFAILRSRFDYWVIGPNELIHKHGLLGDVRGYSTLNMHVEKEIPDVFEWVLFGAGRLIFKPGGMKGEKQDVLIVENVFRVNRAEAQVKKHLGTLRVDDVETH